MLCVYGESGRKEEENEERIPWKGGDTWLELSSLWMAFADRRGMGGEKVSRCAKGERYFCDEAEKKF